MSDLTKAWRKAAMSWREAWRGISNGEEAQELHAQALALEQEHDAKTWVNSEVEPRDVQGALQMTEERLSELERLADGGAASVLIAAGQLTGLISEVRDLKQERYDLLSVKSTDGLLSSEWLMRTAKAEARTRALVSALEQIANLAPGCTASADRAIELAREALR